MLFEQQLSRKPNKYPWTKDYIQAMWNGFWNAQRFTFVSDVNDFKFNITDDERRIITRSLSAIAQIEVQVKRFWTRLGDNLPHPSIESLGIVMAHIEEIHNDAYEKLLEHLNMSSIFEENMKEPVFEKRIRYLTKHNERSYSDKKQQYIYSLVLFTLFTENVSLFSQFYIILWFNRFQNKFKDTAQQVKYTRNEENLHAKIGIKLINTLRDEYPQYFTGDLHDKIVKECYNAYEAESALIDWLVGDFNQPNLSANILNEFVKNRLNNSLVEIGYSKIFNIDDELIDKSKWLDEGVFAETKVDFFNNEPVSYTQSDTSDEDDF